MQSSTGRLTRIALLVALAFVLSAIDAAIPLPVALPGVKLGLANVVVLVAFSVVDTKTAFCLMVLKVAISAFLYGSVLVIAYSLAGGLLSFALTWLLMRGKKLGVVVVSMVAAVAHNTAQVLVAAALLETPAIILSLPFLAIVACATGFATGTAAFGVIKALEERLTPHGIPPRNRYTGML